MKRTIHTRGLVLRRISFSDSSQIVTLFTKDAGVVTVMAKGAHRLPRRSSKFSAPFDLAGWYDIVFRRGGGEVHLATEGRLLEGFDHLRRGVDRWLDACFALDVMPKMFSPGDPHPEFLRGALSYLKLLEKDRGRRALRVHFLGLLLHEGGLAPRYEACLECGAVPAPGLRFRLPIGMVCADCASGGERRVKADVVHYLASEGGAPWSRVPGLDPGPEVLRAAWELQRELLLYHLERPPRTLRYLRD